MRKVQGILLMLLRAIIRSKRALVGTILFTLLFPVLLISIILVTGTLSLVETVTAPLAWYFRVWILLAFPFYFITMLAETNRSDQSHKHQEKIPPFGAGGRRKQVKALIGRHTGMKRIQTLTGALRIMAYTRRSSTPRESRDVDFSTVSASSRWEKLDSS